MKLRTNMRIPSLLQSEVEYARDIVRAGLETPPSTPFHLANVSQSALAPAALGVAIGVLSVFMGQKGRSTSSAVVSGLLGGALGFAGGVAWGTRDQARRYYQHAAHNVQSVRDAHWLEKNPVAYA